MKRIPVILIASACLVMIACSKDTFETKPKIEIKDYNTRALAPGQTLNVTLEYFDKEGDLGGGGIGVILERQNLSVPNIDPIPTDLLLYNLPKFSNRDKGEIVCRIPYGSLQFTTFENDTFLLKFFVADREGNFSDTITSAQIVSLRP